MSARTLVLLVLTAEREVFRGEVSSVVVRAADGELGVLPGHAPLVTVLATGVLRAASRAGEVRLAVSGGLAEVGPARVVVLADVAERPEEIDVARARAALERAREELTAKREGANHCRARAALQRALTRLEVAKWK